MQGHASVTLGQLGYLLQGLRVPASLGQGLQGALCARGQAGIGRTYHPDRFRGPLARGAKGSLEPVSWEEATATLAKKLDAAGGRAWVFGGPTGPTLSGLIDRWIEAVGKRPAVQKGRAVPAPPADLETRAEDVKESARKMLQT